MADVTVKRVEEMESIWGGSFVRARASLGATSFGMNIWSRSGGEAQDHHRRRGHSVALCRWRARSNPNARD